jgi:hypothetical protein
MTVRASAAARGMRFVMTVRASAAASGMRFVMTVRASATAATGPGTFASAWCDAPRVIA